MQTLMTVLRSLSTRLRADARRARPWRRAPEVRVARDDAPIRFYGDPRDVYLP